MLAGSGAHQTGKLPSSVLSHEMVLDVLDIALPLAGLVLVSSFLVAEYHVHRLDFSERQGGRKSLHRQMFRLLWPSLWGKLFVVLWIVAVCVAFLGLGAKLVRLVGG